MRVCNVHGCPELYEGKGGRCPTHASAARARRVDNRVYDTNGHLAFREAVLTRDTICVICCRAQATVADHHPYTRRALVDAGLNPNDPQYGRGLCHRCHSTVTARTPGQQGGWNRRA